MRLIEYILMIMVLMIMPDFFCERLGFYNLDRVIKERRTKCQFIDYIRENLVSI